MSAHRLAALRHRHNVFDRQLSLELKNAQPDEDAMRFFKMQKLRIKDLIMEIEADVAAQSAAPRRHLEAQPFSQQAFA